MMLICKGKRRPADAGCRFANAGEEANGHERAAVRAERWRDHGHHSDRNGCGTDQQIEGVRRQRSENTSAS